MNGNDDNPVEEACASQLAQANLLRMRRQWDEANRLCLHVLYESPDSWRAHALLGDVAFERGDPDEAIQWYCMALDIRPDAQATRDKLSSIVNSRRSEVSRDITLRLGGEAVRTRSLHAMHSLSSHRVRRVRIAAAVVIAGAIGAGLLALPLKSRPLQRQIIEPVFTPGGTPTLETMAVSRQTIVTVPQQASQSNQPQTPQSAVQQSGSATPPTTSNQAQRPAQTSLTDTDEEKLTEDLRRDLALKSQGIEVDNCVIDPTNAAATVTITSAAPEDATSQLIETMAASAARTALAQSGPGELRQCTVRYMALSGGAQTILFQGTLQRSAGASEQTPPQAGSPFSATWWSPAISSAQPAAAPAATQPAAAAPRLPTAGSPLST